MVQCNTKVINRIKIMACIKSSPWWTKLTRKVVGIQIIETDNLLIVEWLLMRKVMLKKSSLSDLNRICQLKDSHHLTITLPLNPNKRKLVKESRAKARTEADHHSRTCSTRMTRNPQEAKPRMPLVQLPKTHQRKKRK